MVRLDQPPDNYYLRFASYPDGDMQQVIEGQAIVSYDVRQTSELDFHHAQADLLLSLLRLV